MKYIGEEFNGHTGKTVGGYDGVHGCFSFRDRNGGDTSMLNFAQAFNLQGLILSSFYLFNLFTSLLPSFSTIFILPILLK